MIADTYLSVSTPVQARGRGADRARRARFARRSWPRVRRNLESLRKLAAAFPSIDVLRVEGGWSAVVQVPQLRTEEALVLELLEKDDVLVHPGYFFDFAREAYIVLSLLVEPARIRSRRSRAC